MMQAKRLQVGGAASVLPCPARPGASPYTPTSGWLCLLNVCQVDKVKEKQGPEAGAITSPSVSIYY